ncbi:MAG: substrate-binding domain-containing protein [Kiritimatiellia bacterium]
MRRSCKIVHRLEESGHAAFFASKTQSELSHSLPRLRRLVEEQPADAWIVVDGARALLAWFAERKSPVLAIGGQVDNLSISTVSPCMMPAGRAAMQRLIDLGHRRVVLICTRNERAGANRPEHTVGASLAALAACGVKISPFNLPEWDETPAGLQTLLHSLFRVTPPTALVVMRPTWATGVLSFLATRGLRVPQQVSVVGYGLEALNPWHVPALAYLCAEDLPVVRRTVRWVRQVARGVVSPRRYAYPGLFVDGPSLGPAPG